MQQRRLGVHPEQPKVKYRIVFDGGAIGNPGRGYGSFDILGSNGYHTHDRLDYSRNGERVTSNEAEYRTLIHALDRLARDLGEGAAAAEVDVFGDSQLVIFQLNGLWKVRKETLQPLHAEASRQLRRFGSTRLQWHGRENSVRLLGH